MFASGGSFIILAHPFLLCAPKAPSTAPIAASTAPKAPRT